MDYRKLSLPVGFVIYIISFLEPNWPYHLFVGHYVAAKILFNPLFYAILPLLLYVVMLLRRKRKTPSPDLQVRNENQGADSQG